VDASVHSRRAAARRSAGLLFTSARAGTPIASAPCAEMLLAVAGWFGLAALSPF